MRDWFKETFKEAGLYVLGLAIVVSIVIGLDHLQEEGIEIWPLFWYESRPDCVGAEVQTLVLDLTQGLVLDQVPRDVPLPFVTDALSLGIILDHGTDDANIQHCWAEVFSLWTYDPAKQYRVGEVTYIVADDAADPSQYVVRVTLDTLNLNWQPE